MGREASEQASSWVERRGSERVRASGSVRLQTAGGDWRGSLWDLSETGARIEIANPPPNGATALLHWDDLELFCRIIWVREDGCGLAFDKPISAALVEQEFSRTPPPAGPTATLGNIPVGQKRRRSFGPEE